MRSVFRPRLVAAAYALALCAADALIAAEGVSLSASRNRIHVTLSWPLSTNNFLLESATSLEPSDWQGVTELITIDGAHYQVTVSAAEAERYFRLRRVELLSSPGVSTGTPTNGYITAVLRSECTSAPPPPPVGETVVGADYVIKTVADGDPSNYQAAQQIVTDAVFESLMPLYCGLPDEDCITNRVQWNLLTYDVSGNPRISGSPLSGPAFHYCPVTKVTSSPQSVAPLLLCQRRRRWARSPLERMP